MIKRINIVKQYKAMNLNSLPTRRKRYRVNNEINKKSCNNLL